MSCHRVAMMSMPPYHIGSEKTTTTKCDKYRRTQALTCQSEITALVPAIAQGSIGSGSMPHWYLLAVSSSTSDAGTSAQYLQRIFASSPTFTDRVIMHRAMKETTNRVHGTETAITNSRHVFVRSKRANTMNASFCKYQRHDFCFGKQKVFVYVALSSVCCTSTPTQYFLRRIYCSRFTFYGANSKIMNDLGRRARRIYILHIQYLVVEALKARLCRIIITVASVCLQKL